MLVSPVNKIKNKINRKQKRLKLRLAIQMPHFSKAAKQEPEKHEKQAEDAPEEATAMTYREVLLRKKALAE
ncbi:uncharacterized protein ASCRUDRAFT_79485 [Ascoidea rubescens DSM 1968]|uniref:Uncharacterized protein n=1 Tax=Ascoidea rubescens DSM 1968 TaxID=1344418 RepID=A0A1D2VML8_9ASCO|nr:hypothetical protein ASCRUDRAFT_79485 [Ascoidea rubescens DSM 1968]ODV62853.1 hypothetical protein ASCRUDRAFT_79485 [Ascoidea rubescens DSM 1968]